MHAKSPHTRLSPPVLAIVSLGSLAVFWGAVLAAAVENPGYSHRRDYLSTLAAHGAHDAWLGVLAICAASLGIFAAGLLLGSVSRTAAILMALAGAGFVVVAFSRLECPTGAAGCGLGGRFEVSGATELTHWTATTVSTVMLIVAVALTGVALLRRRRALAGALTIGAATVTAGAFLAMGGDSPGWSQRVGVVVATAWLASAALVALIQTPDAHVAHGRE